MIKTDGDLPDQAFMLLAERPQVFGIQPEIFVDLTGGLLKDFIHFGATAHLLVQRDQLESRCHLALEKEGSETRGLKRLVVISSGLITIALRGQCRGQSEKID